MSRNYHDIRKKQRLYLQCVDGKEENDKTFVSENVEETNLNSASGSSDSVCLPLSPSIPRPTQSQSCDETESVHIISEKSKETCSDTNEIPDIEIYGEEQTDVEDNVSANVNTDLKHPLETWALAHNISHSALNGLLKLLKPLHEDLPLKLNRLVMYLIVIFEIENSVEGVPKSWVTEVNGWKYCFWPKKSENISRLVKRKEPPHEDWAMVKCRVKYEAATYEEMRLKLKEAENITTEYNSSDSDTCSTSHTIQASTSLKKNSRSNRAISLSEEDEELAFPPPPVKKLCFSSSGKPKSTIGEPSGSCSNCRNEIKLLRTEMLKVCCQIRMSNDLIHKEVLTIGQDIKILKAMNKSTSNKGEKEIIFPDFPFQSTDDLDDFDLTLKNQEDTKNALIKYLKNLGGVSYKGALHVMLRKLISPQIGVLYSLKGRTGKKLKFDSLELFKCIKSSIMENSNYAGITVTEIERVVGIWLIHSKYKKREKKI